jgi:thiol-disulfide isomerase/thioredoxin
MRKAIFSLALVCLVCLNPIGLGIEPDGTVSIPIGSQIGNLAFKDIRYLPRSLADFRGAKAFVLCFLTNDCPVAQRYLPTLQRLHEEYAGQGVQFVAINVGAEDSIRAVARHALDHGLTMPAVKDFTGACANAVGVTRTPEVAVLDAQKKLRYRGRIDDRFRVGGGRSAATTHDLKNALDDLLAGKEVRTAETPLDGCIITIPPLPAPKQPVTYSEHIAPILRSHCIECHRPETAAPFSLLTYEQTAARARTIAEVTHEERMPPWYAAADTGKWANQRGLTSEERTLIRQWVKHGMPTGDLTKLPPVADEVIHPKSKWNLGGEPDLVLSAGAHDIPAEGLVQYRYVIIPHLFTEDTWIGHLQILPSNPRTVHHANMAYMVLGEGFKMQNFITGYVPGGEPMRLYGGTAFKIPAKSVVGLQIHYVTTGKPEKCEIKIGMRYAKETVQKQLRFHLLANYRFAIPPGAPAHRVEAGRTLDRDVEPLALFAHMHLRGRDMTFKFQRPDAKEAETLLTVPNYSFDWQMPYRFPDGTPRLPKGTKLLCIAHFDNSPFNPYNPDPTATVRDGEQTHQEMMNGFFFYTAADEKLGLEIDPQTGRVRKSDE